MIKTFKPGKYNIEIYNHFEPYHFHFGKFDDKFVFQLCFNKSFEGSNNCPFCSLLEKNKNKDNTKLAKRYVGYIYNSSTKFTDFYYIPIKIMNEIKNNFNMFEVIEVSFRYTYPSKTETNVFKIDSIDADLYTSTPSPNLEKIFLDLRNELKNGFDEAEFDLKEKFSYLKTDKGKIRLIAF